MTTKKTKLTYSDSGVDIDEANQLIDNIRDFRKTGFTDPDGSTGFEGFWDVNLRKDIERFFGI